MEKAKTKRSNNIIRVGLLQNGERNLEYDLTNFINPKPSHLKTTRAADWYRTACQR